MNCREKGLEELIGREEGDCKRGEGGWKLHKERADFNLLSGAEGSLT